MPEPNFSRREMLQMALAAGGAGVVGREVYHSVGALLAQDPARMLTPEQVMGPFYPAIKPLDRDADLTIVGGGGHEATRST